MNGSLAANGFQKEVSSVSVKQEKDFPLSKTKQIQANFFFFLNGCFKKYYFW